MAHRVYVGNLPFTCSPEDLKQLFAAHAPTATSIVIDRDTGRSRGFGFVDFASTESMLLAIQAMHGRPVNGRPLTVSEARERQPGDRPARGSGTGGPPRATGAGRAGGDAPSVQGGGSSAPARGRPAGPAPAHDRPRPSGRKPWEQKERGDRWSDGGGKPRRRRGPQDDEDEGF
jgi:RNA recognition motif-containing protein